MNVSKFTTPSILFIFLLVIHFLTPFYSVGYFHCDEHFQILEFLQLKIQPFDSKELPWEFHSDMRSWFLPSTLFVITKFFSFFGVKSPFTLEIIFRQFYAILGLISALMVGDLIKRKTFSENIKKWAYVIPLCLWFVPYLHSRLSSEVISGHLFIIGYCLSESQQKNKNSNLHHLIAGFIFGIAFAIRLHTIVLSGILFLYFLFQKRYQQVLLTTITFFLANGMCALIDFWGSGHFYLPMIEYFNQNLIHDKASNYGTSPFIKYFKDVLLKPIPIIGLLIFTFWFVDFYKKRFSFIAVSSFIFILLHSLIPHKEWRFIWVLAPMAPFAIVDILGKYLKTFVLINIPILIYFSFQAVDDHTGLFKYFAKQGIQKIYSDAGNLPNRFGELYYHFYPVRELNAIAITSPSDLLKVREPNKLVFVDRYQKIKDYENINCNLEYKSDNLLPYKLGLVKKIFAVLRCP